MSPPKVSQQTRGRLRLFLDSAQPRAWEKYANTGALYGVTTNPIILERDNCECSVENLTRLCTRAFNCGLAEVMLQAWGGSTSSMYHVALDLAGIDPQRVVVKLPCTQEGLECASLLRDSGIRICVTGLYTAHQVLLCEAIGAEYAAPYLGRMTDMGKEGNKEVVLMQDSLTSLESDMRLLVASIRNVHDLPRLAARGCDTFTLAPALLDEMMDVQATAEATVAFEQAARLMSVKRTPASGGGAVDDAAMATPVSRAGTKS